ncbi:MAG: DUF1761 domain-containing protein [Deltaproteobacteria bacterium]|nr:DUF1761 domain-containing protein [Deltaproteobacteria bacterium]
MSKMNCKRVFLGGLVAGIVFIVLGFASYFIYLGDAWKCVMEELGYPLSESVGMYIYSIVGCFFVGILAVWLYAAIRPRYGAGPGTGVLAGFVFWVLSVLLPYISLGAFGMFPARLLIIDCLIALVIIIVATLLGAWVYREESEQVGSSQT